VTSFPTGAGAETAVQRLLRDAREGRLEAAMVKLRGRIQRQPGDLEARQALALLLLQSGQPLPALHQLERSIQAAPKLPGLRNNYANALMTLGRFGEANEQCKKAVAIDPSYHRAWLGQVLCLTQLGDPDGALNACERAYPLRSDWPELICAHASALEAADRLEDAIALVAKALNGRPHDLTLHARLLPMLNNVIRPIAQVNAAYRAYAAAIPALVARPNLERKPNQKLRIGVLSADLRSHSVGYFCEPFLRHRPDDCTLIACNSSPPCPDDPLQIRLRGCFEQWIEAGFLDDAALDLAIRDARIDVLLELSGHTSGSRLSALNGKPAAVIVTAIGYPNTTGHPAVDWRIVDSITDPVGCEDHCSERLLRLDPCFLCYCPPADAPVPASPAPEQPFTFGSFNTSSKISSETLGLWAAVMGEVANAQLLIKSKSLSGVTARENFLRRLNDAGIARERVEILSYTATVAEHLALYQRIHVALDTTPYNGTTTTCEALWMGVQVIALNGDRHAARVTASLLSAAGLSQWIAESPAQFVAIAKTLAADPLHLVTHRQGLRAQLAASTLTNTPAYAERFYQAVCSAWESRLTGDAT